MPTKVRTIVQVSEKWRLSVAEAADLCGIGRNTVTELERREEFPPRVPVRAAEGEPCKLQYIAAEVRAWAEGRDWRAMVRQRTEASRAS